jgi:hypothetical protein
VPVGQLAAPLGPEHQRQPAQAEAVQPGPLLTRGEVQVGLRPLVGPVVLAGRVIDAAVEAGAAQPVLPGQLERVLDAGAALLRRADQEQPAERPEGLAAQVGRRFLVQQQYPPAGVGQFRGRDQARQPSPHHDDIAVSHACPPSLTASRLRVPSRIICYRRVIRQRFRVARRPGRRLLIKYRVRRLSSW